MTPAPEAAAGEALVAECRERAVRLLRENLSREGILAASAGQKAAVRNYLSVFGRDAAVCALGMAVSGDPVLREGAETGLVTLAEHQAPNGQIPKFVHCELKEADFWYVGCIDATLWWLLALDALDRHEGSRRLVTRFAPQVALATGWLLAQEHQHYHLLQQNEASDWADIMPRSGFVLYTNALWYLVKRRYGLAMADSTREHAHHLFRPFDANGAAHHRAERLADHARTHARDRGLFLSFVNFAAFGDEGDVFGNILAVLCGLAGDDEARAVMRALLAAGVDDPYPVRVTCEPIAQDNPLWRPYMERHSQNFAWQYHNGGIWPFVGGLWVTALARVGETQAAKRALGRLAQANALGDWAFCEWLHGQTASLGGMRGQSWNAATFLLASAEEPFDWGGPP
ncbi:MAG: amylo-alpha-1,6-glucosidase [Burkholderiales bacterium]